MPRYLSLLLIPLTLLGQAWPTAVCGCLAAAGDEQAGRPHVHLSWLLGGTAHGPHEHGSSTCQAASHTDRHSAANLNLAVAALHSATAPAHDHDALFLPVEVSQSRARSGPRIDFAAAELALDAAALFASEQNSLPTIASDRSLAHRRLPIYLRLAALRV